MSTQIIDALNWRYAVKQFDANKKVSTDQLNTILESGRLAPSSLGFQPWSFIVVTDAELRAQLRKASWDQSQITDSSHLLVVARRTDLNEAYVHRVIENIAQTRGIKPEDLHGLKGMMMGKLQGSSPQELASWSALQCYLALGMMLETAALMKVDTCPMEGFDASAYDSVLGLQEKNLASVVVLAIGFRSEQDKYASAAKARLPLEEVLHHV